MTRNKVKVAGPFPLGAIPGVIKKKFNKHQRIERIWMNSYQQVIKEISGNNNLDQLKKIFIKGSALISSWMERK